jgi:bacterioferritin-associated ferredoxin
MTVSMIVCVCNAITETDVRELARSGVTTPEEAYAVLGHEPQCRSCLCYAQDLIDEVRGHKRPHLRAVA